MIIEQNKKQLRKSILEKRMNISHYEVELVSANIIQKAIEVQILDKCNIVMLYMDFGNEVMTKDLALFCSNNHIKLAYPRVEKEPHIMTARLVQNNEKDMKIGAYGILEPKPELEHINPLDIDLIIVPGVVFDEKKNRLGYGGGYYDTFLAKVRRDCRKVALAFDIQIIRQLPVDIHDIPMDMIITDKRIF